MNVVLIGFRGSGKSTVGRCLAQRLGWPFVDTDALIEQRAGKTIREIYAEQAEVGFRRLESAVVAEVAGLEGHIIGTGGGVILREAHVGALRQHGKLIYLAAPVEMLWERITQDAHRIATRPTIDPKIGLQSFQQTLAQREPIYRQVADCVIETAEQSVDRIVETIIVQFDLCAI